MKKTSVFTNITFWLGVLALVVEFIVGYPYFLSTDTFEQEFGQKAIMEGCFALVGLLFIDVIRGNKFKLKPEFRKYEFNSLWRGAIILAVLWGTQMITYFLPMTVSDPQMALAITFASICEEIFFRGFVLTLFIKAGEIDRNKINLPFTKRDISVIEIAGIIISSVAFAGIHTNYYNQPSLLIALFLSGVIIGFMFVIWEDLTACIFGHFLLNFIWTVQNYGFWFFGMVNL